MICIFSYLSCSSWRKWPWFVTFCLPVNAGKTFALLAIESVKLFIFAYNLLFCVYWFDLSYNVSKYIRIRLNCQCENILIFDHSHIYDVWVLMHTIHFFNFLISSLDLFLLNCAILVFSCLQLIMWLYYIITSAQKT